MTEPLTPQREAERMSPQQCPKGVHADWAVDSELEHTCPWCELERLRDWQRSYRAGVEFAGREMRKRLTDAEAERDALQKRLGRAISIYTHSGSKPYHKGWNEAAAWVRDAAAPKAEVR